MKREISLRKWLKRYWMGVLLAVLVMYLLSQFFVLMKLTERSERNLCNSISIVEQGVEDSLLIVDSFIYESLYSGSTQSTSHLYRELLDEQDLIGVTNARLSVLKSLQSLVTWSDMIDSI
ncbi:MAG: hypothetical protein HUJ70_15560, partial [Pseudobutyrivibrio sp.]|nr:hypothetical protein [Pseudobutyrivibrio sp.]